VTLTEIGPVDCGPMGAAELRRFNTELQTVIPPSPSGNWLLAYWEPGYPWGTIGRYVIAEVTPRGRLAMEAEFYASLGEHQAAKETVLHELEGPDPWEGGHYCTKGNCICDKKKERFVYREGLVNPSITHRQWVLYRTYGGLAKPIWIVQGKRGGHKRHFNAFEQGINRIRHRPTEPPYPGELEYAPLDNRVLESLRKARDLAKMQAGLKDDWAYRVGREDEHGIEGVTDAERALYKEWSSWIDDQLDNDLSGR
jgi:hypothetical protein